MTQSLTWSNIQRICREHALFSDAMTWLQPLLESAQDWPTAADLNVTTKKLNPDFPWEFVSQAKVPRRARSRGESSLTGYVSMIAMHGKIPFREKNPHDFLNCLLFLIFPESKSALNLRHLKESPEGLKPGQNRTRTQDLLTIFDEGGVVRLIKNNGTAKDLIFGHAIYEHILGENTLRAARLDFPAPDELLDKSICEITAFADKSFARWLQNEDNCLSSKEFSHVWITP